MTTDAFTDAARAYAEQACYQDENIPIAEAGFRAGWKAALTHLTAQDPTDTEVEAVAASILWETSGRHWEDVDEGERREHHRYARAALSAARAARRDEEKQDG